MKWGTEKIRKRILRNYRSWACIKQDWKLFSLHTLSKSAQTYPNVPKRTQTCQNVPKCAKTCQNVPKRAQRYNFVVFRIFQEPWLDKFLPYLKHLAMPLLKKFLSWIHSPVDFGSSLNQIDVAFELFGEVCTSESFISSWIDSHVVLEGVSMKLEHWSFIKRQLNEQVNPFL